MNEFAVWYASWWLWRYRCWRTWFALSVVYPMSDNGRELASCPQTHLKSEVSYCVISHETILSLFLHGIFFTWPRDFDDAIWEFGTRAQGHSAYDKLPWFDAIYQCSDFMICWLPAHCVQIQTQASNSATSTPVRILSLHTPCLSPSYSHFLSLS